MKILCYLLAIWALPSVANTQRTEPPTETSITTTAPMAEDVIVEAPEPRYVAPTQRDRIGRVWAPVLINGQGPFRLVLDTGANGSAVTASVVTQLGVPTLNSHIVYLYGVTGSARVPAIAVDRLEVGDLILEGKRLPVLSDVFGGAQGVLGTEGLMDKRVHIDFGRDWISITRSRKQRAEMGFSQIPLTLGRDRLPMFDIMIGSVRAKAILDTGAQQTIGNRALRNRLKRRSSDHGKAQDILGVTPDIAQGELMQVPTVHIGAVQIRGLHLAFSDVFIFEHWNLTDEPALLIGMDIIGSLDVVVIDYKKRELQIRARRATSLR
jgi:predicted aspartyl protease